MVVIIAYRTLSLRYLLYVRISQWPQWLAEGSKLSLNPDANSSQPMQWAVAFPPLDAGSSLLFTWGVFIFCPAPGIPAQLRGVHPVLLCKWACTWQDSFAEATLWGALYLREVLWKWAGFRGLAVTCRAQSLGRSVCTWAHLLGNVITKRPKPAFKDSAF